MGEAATTGTVRSADGTTIAYERSGTGPAVILVDAAGGFREMGPMRSLAARLAEEFAVLTYDRRRRGQSTDRLPYAPQREVEDLRALIDAAGGSAALYGFSSGAVLALLAAAGGLPVTRLAVLEPQSDARLRGWAQGVAEKLPAGRHRTLPGEWHGVSDEVLAPVLADHFSGRAD